MTHRLLPLLLLLLPVCLFGQKTDKKLQSKINDLVQGFHGDVGIYVKNLRTGKTAAFHADSVYPTASMVKVSILIGIMDKIERGELQYHQELVYKDSLLYKGVDILGAFKDNEKIELSKVMMLMITLFEKIHSGQIVSAAACERMLRLLGRDYWDEEALSQIPPDVFAACKSGSLDSYRSETVLVMAPHGPYIFSIITNHLADTTWTPGNEGWILARKLSRLLWQTYEPRSRWTPSIRMDGKPT